MIFSSNAIMLSLTFFLKGTLFQISDVALSATSACFFNTQIHHLPQKRMELISIT